MDLSEKTERAEQRLQKFRKIRNIVTLVLVAGLLIYGAIHFYYPYGEGVKSGQLNYVVYKGIIFKTYEGKLIQTGIRSQGGGIQSNEFEFSVADEKIAKELMLAGGKTVELHYTEYFGAIPWRGYSRYVVDSIVSMSSGGVSQEMLVPSEEI